MTTGDQLEASAAGPLAAAAETFRVVGEGGVGLVVDRWAGERVGALLVHGLASNARLWDGVVAELLQRGHAVATVDLRGHGQSDKPDGGYDMATVADDVVAVLRALRDGRGSAWDRPVVAGQSFGGNVVLEAAVRAPGLVRAVVAVDGGMIELADRFPDREEARRALAPPQLEGTPVAAVRQAVRAAHPSWSELAVAGVMANFEVRPDGTVAPWLTRGRHLEILDGLWAHRPSEVARQLTVPLTLLVADDGGDSPWTADKRRAVDRVAAAAGAGATVRWFSPADHDLHAELPGPVAEAIAGAASAP
jgi:pimeloyl-ACP methyl ester carboxylesterase